MKKYKVTFQQNGILNSIIVNTSNIKNEVLPSNVINIREINNFFSTFKYDSKLKSNEISDLFFELNIILQAKIPLYEALEILSNSSRKRHVHEIILKMKVALKSGTPIYKALQVNEKQLGSVVIGFLKIAHDNGNMNDCIYSLSILLKSINENNKMIKSKFTYPIILFISLIFSLISIFNFVIPQFENIFSQYNASLPIATVALLNLKYFLLNYSLYIILFFSMIYFFLLIKYKKSINFRYKFDKFIITKIPILGQIIFINYFHRFFLSLKILLGVNYKFQSSIINSSILLKNQYLFDRMTALNKRIQSGETISDAFVNTRLFDELTLRLINTAERSNSMYQGVNEIEKIYSQKLNDKIKLFSSLIEPIFIIIIMLLIIWVVLAVLVPMWGIGEVIKI